MKVLHVVGSHSGFFRLAPVFRALRAAGADRQVIVYAGHREDLVPADMFLQELELPGPDHVLGVSSGSSATRTGRSVIALESVVSREAPDWIFAVGDVDASLAAALVGRKNGVPLAHLEAGLRTASGPPATEVNRLLTDRLSDALFVAERATGNHLVEEGIDSDRIHFVGNTVADGVLRLRGSAAALELPSVMGQDEGSYVVAMLTRADGLPCDTSLEEFLQALDGVAFESGRSTILVLDPWAAAGVHEQGLEPLLAPMTVLQSPSYVELLALVDGAGAVVTNACEILDAAAILGVPTVAIGDFTVGRSTTLFRSLHIPGEEVDRLPEVVIQALEDRTIPSLPELWDGRAAQRIAEITMAHLMASVA
jgi:UDP-N-acetylglucosamine 2-epimerase (non-hydrolysing)